MVDKNRRKNRQTVHVDENLEDAMAGVSGAEVAELYAQVSKGGGGVPQASGNGGVGVTTASNGHGGARPKFRNPDFNQGSFPNSSAAAATSNGTVNPTGYAASGASNDPGYSTIGSVSHMRVRNSTLPRNSELYEEVGDVLPSRNNTDTGSEYDPNYEKVGNVARSPVPGVGATGGFPSTVAGLGCTGLTAPRDPSGVAREIAPQKPTSSKLGRRSKQTESWHKHEHIYQEIKEAKKSGRRKHTHSGGEGTML